MSEPPTRPALASSFDAAVALLRNGEFGEAARVAGQVLAEEPRHAGALHLLGTIKAQQRELAAALELFARALDQDGTRADFWFSHGVVLKELHRFEEAIASLEQAVERDPGHALAICVRGDCLAALGRPAEALACFDRALSTNPNLVDAINNRGNALRALGRHAEALAAYDRALAMVPQHGAAMVNRGNALFELGRFEEALGVYGKALLVMPDLPQLHVKVGDTLQSLDRFGDALARHDRALQLAPDLVQAVNGRAAALTWLRRLEEAEQAGRRAIAINPGYAPAYNALGNAMRELGQIDEAVSCFAKAVSLEDGLNELHFNLGYSRLLRGEMNEEVWRAYEYRSRLRTAGSAPAGAAAPLWQGEPVAGKRVLVWTEQGIGDSIQFMRLVPRLAERGASVVLYAPAHIERLLQSNSLGIRVTSQVEGEAFDYTVSLMSLPFHLGLTLDTIPASVPYLAAEPALVARWQERLAGLGAGFKIGVAWQGNATARIDIGRSFAVAALAPIAAVPGVRLVSLQKGAGVEQLETLPAGMTVERLEDFDTGPDAFFDTAAIVNCLDLVITSDTAVAHLAGALGRPVWVGLQHVPEWRWLMERTDTPWYPTMRLFRQPVRGDWDGVFADMASALSLAMRPKRADPVAPVSWGELADKISILEIKTARIMEGVQRANVARELAALSPLLDAIDNAPEGLSALRAELRSINERLWDIEDQIRGKEACLAFDSEFVALARAVYTTNDERGRLKRRINELLGSNLVEEKQYTSYVPATGKAGE